MNRYVAVVVAAFAGLVVIGVVARLSVFGGWTPAFYVPTSLVLIVVAGVALYRGVKRDQELDQDDY